MLTLLNYVHLLVMLQDKQLQLSIEIGAFNKVESLIYINKYFYVKSCKFFRENSGFIFSEHVMVLLDFFHEDISCDCEEEKQKNFTYEHIHIRRKWNGRNTRRPLSNAIQADSVAERAVGNKTKRSPANGR